MSPQDRDIAIRTMLGEEGDPLAQAGVAATMINRARAGGYGGKTLSSVALAPGQFEPWQARPNDLWAIPTNDPGYVQAGKILDGVASGDISDPTGGATHFYAPAAQKALGRNPPKWDDGSGVPLGKTLFFAPKASAAPASAAIASAADPFSEYPTSPAPAPKAASTPDPFSEYPTAAAPSGISGSVSFSSAPADPFSEYPTSAAPISQPTARMAGAVPGPNGLLWNQTGGFDPKTGELVIAGKPLQEPAASQTRAAVAGFAGGVPIIGPAIVGAATQAGAGLRNLLTGQPTGQIVSAEQGADAAAQAAYPKTAFGAGMGGAMAGIAPAMIAAPAAFGAAEGAPLIANALTGAATGAGIGAADAVARNGLSLGNAETGAIAGGLGGAAGPVIGAGVGKALSAGSNLLMRTTPGAANVANMLRTAGMTPMQAEAELARNPRLVPADLSPSMTTDAGALAAQGGTPTEILKASMKARAKGADDQIQQIAVANLGPRPDPTAAKEAIQASASTAAEPFYSAARASPTPMDITPILNDINSQLKMAPAGSGEAAVLNKAKGYLTDQKVTTPGTPGGKPTTLIVPKEDPGALLKARQALDGDIDSLQRNGTIDGTSAGKSAYRAANDIRGQLDGVLKTDPNMAAGDQAYASRIVAKEDLDNGTNIFKTPIADFQRGVAAASADPARLQAMQQGGLAALHDKLGGVTGDYAAARNLFAKGTDNRAKMDALFPGAGQFFDNLQDEIAMRGTEQGVAGGSQTAERTAAGRKYAPAAGGPEINPAIPLLGEAVGGAPLAAGATAAKMVYGNLRNAFTEAGRQRLMEQTARGLVSTGPEQSQFMGQVGRAFRAAPITQGLAGGGAFATNLLSRPLTQIGTNRLFPPAQ